MANDRPESMDLDPRPTVAGESSHQDPPSQTNAEEPMSQVPTDSTGSSANTHEVGNSSSSTTGPSGDPAEPTATIAPAPTGPNPTNDADSTVPTPTNTAGATIPIAESLLFTHSDFASWDKYDSNNEGKGDFDIWQLTPENGEPRSTITTTGAAEAYLGLLTALSSVHTHWSKTADEVQRTQYKIANCVFKAVKENRDLSAVWQYDELADIKLNSIIDRSSYDKFGPSILLHPSEAKEATDILTKIQGQ